MKDEDQSKTTLKKFVEELSDLIPASNVEAHGRLIALKQKAMGSDELDDLRDQIMNQEEKIEILKEQQKAAKKRLDGLKEEERDLISKLSDDMDMVTRANLETEWLQVQAEIEANEPHVHTVLIFDTNTETFLGTLKKLTKQQLERCMELTHRFAKTQHFNKPRFFNEKNRLNLFKERHDYLVQHAKVETMEEEVNAAMAEMDAKDGLKTTVTVGSTEVAENY